MCSGGRRKQEEWITLGEGPPLREESVMEIKVLGSGCNRCKATKEIILEALAETGADSQLVEVTGLSEILEYKVMATPGVVIDGKVVSSGRIPSKKEVLDWLEGGSL